METRAYLKGTRLSAQKAGLVADVVRGKISACSNGLSYFP